MDGLAQIGPWTILAILAKAIGYATTLVAVGSPMFIAVFRSSASDDVLRLAQRLAVFAALIGLAILALRFGIRSARISGMGFAGTIDPVMLSFVLDSPLGKAALWRGTGELLIIAIMLKNRLGLAISVAGALLVASSYAMIGHSVSDPRGILAGIIVIHFLTAAFWVGALMPLHRAARTPSGAELLHQFGKIASVTVVVLVLAGLSFAWLMIGSVGGLFGTAYGWLLIAKIVLVGGLMGLAAKNKLWYVPSVAAGDILACDQLCRSIRLEIVAVVVILLITATLTSITTPPLNL